MLRRMMALATAFWSLISPIWISPFAVVSAFGSTAVAHAQTVGEQIKNVPYKMALATTSLHPIKVETEKQPDFDAEIGKPLRDEAAKTAEQARLAALQAARKHTTVIVNTGDVWASLRFCEAGGDYTKNTGNGFYGAYQFDYGTWAGYGGYATANLAPPAVQDAKARETQARRGWYPWPACARKLGLI